MSQRVRPREVGDWTDALVRLPTLARRRATFCCLKTPLRGSRGRPIRAGSQAVSVYVHGEVVAMFRAKAPSNGLVGIVCRLDDGPPLLPAIEKGRQPVGWDTGIERPWRCHDCVTAGLERILHEADRGACHRMTIDAPAATNE